MKQRHIILAQNRTAPEASELDMMDLARIIDRDAWQLVNPKDGYTRRLKSIVAADRILTHQHSARAALCPEPEPVAPTWIARLAAWVFPRAGVAQ